MQQQNERTAAGAALSDVVLDLFRVNNGLLTQGDRLVAPLGLTSARWQVLGTIVAAERPQPVAWLARDMGGNRQNVQRIVNDLAKEGWVAFADNPHHRRASLIVLTDLGREAYNAAMKLQAPWINRLAEGMSLEDIAVLRQVLSTLQARLTEDGVGDAQA
ncbi:MarR family winged helix-turn-helix transcriptional regulator [Chromobacterium vaccinii]|uniref:MarR family winged helix-turn-helix transcriptional regulator n=1 Tax=Chromobacterium vaccinii TaxID=1108595 RepID=UPI001E53E30F|nr:MarR family transcriptional regulator [Chromobacterium vaccinii]MCD4502138.1 MarR family transcriptional regulator [Chromobacterium vaccinii]